MGIDDLVNNKPERGRTTKPGQSRRNEVRKKPRPEAQKPPTIEERAAEVGAQNPPPEAPDEPGGQKRRKRRGKALDKVVGRQQELIAGWVLDLGEGIDEIKGSLEAEGLKVREKIDGYRALGELATTATNLLRMVHDKPGSLSDSTDVEQRVGQLIQLHQRRGGTPLPPSGTV